MIPYSNLSRDSNIKAYETGADFIIIHFFTGYWRQYTYTNRSAGSSVIQQMQQLSEHGEGLNSYIQRNKPPYASKC